MQNQKELGYKPKVEKKTERGRHWVEGIRVGKYGTRRELGKLHNKVAHSIKKLYCLAYTRVVVCVFWGDCKL